MGGKLEAGGNGRECIEGGCCVFKKSKEENNGRNI
jgi:hypothetical protein